jgi:hypothetical protein
MPQLYLSLLDKREIDHGLRQWFEGVGSGLQVAGLRETLVGVVEDEKSCKEEKTDEGKGEKGTGDEEKVDEGTGDEGKVAEGTGDEGRGAEVTGDEERGVEGTVGG